MSTGFVDGEAGYAADSGLRARVPPKYSITRGKDDVLQWDPPTGSRELANALSYHYPMENGLQEKMQRAILDFFDAENETAKLPSGQLKMGLNLPANPEALDSAIRIGNSSTDSQKPPEKSEPSSQKGRGQEMRGVWDIRTGESVKSSWRTRPLSPRRRKEVAENRGNACERHRKSKTRCDPTRCPENKLYPGTSINSTLAQEHGNRKRDHEDESLQDGSQALIESPSTIKSHEGGSLNSAKASLSLSPSSSQSATQSGDGQTPSDRGGYSDNRSYLSIGDESGLTSFVSYSDHSNPPKRMRLDDAQNLSKDLPSNALDASILFDYVPGNEMLFPWTMNPVAGRDMSPGVIEQSPYDFRRQKDWPFVQQDFSGVNVDWIEALMASDMPPLNFDWSGDPNANLEPHNYAEYIGQSAVNMELRKLQQVAAEAWPVELSSELQAAPSTPETSSLRWGLSGTERFDLGGIEDMSGIAPSLGVSASIDDCKLLDNRPGTHDMIIENKQEVQKGFRARAFSNSLASSSSPRLSMAFHNAASSLPFTVTEKASANHVHKVADSPQPQELVCSFKSSTAPAGAISLPIFGESGLESVVHGPSSAPLRSIGAIDSYANGKKSAEIRIASANISENPKIRGNGFTRMTGAVRSFTSHKRTYIQDLSALLHESGIKFTELLQQQYPPPLNQEDTVPYIDIILFGISKVILSPIIARLGGQLRNGESRVRLFHSSSHPYFYNPEDESPPNMMPGVSKTNRRGGNGVDTQANGSPIQDVLERYIMSLSGKALPTDISDSQRPTILISYSSDMIVVKRAVVVKKPINNPSVEQSEFSYEIDWVDCAWRMVEDIIDDQQIAAPDFQYSYGSISLLPPAASSTSHVTASINLVSNHQQQLLPASNQLPACAPILLSPSPSPHQQIELRRKVEIHDEWDLNNVFVEHKDSIHSSVGQSKAAVAEEEVSKEGEDDEAEENAIMNQADQEEPYKDTTVPALMPLAGIIQSKDNNDFAKEASAVKSLSHRMRRRQGERRSLRRKVSYGQSTDEHERAKEDSTTQELPQVASFLAGMNEDELIDEVPFPRVTNKLARLGFTSPHIQKPPRHSMGSPYLNDLSTSDPRPLQPSKRTEQDEGDHNVDVADAIIAVRLVDEELATQEEAQEIQAEGPLSDEEQYALDMAEIKAIEDEIRLLPPTDAELTIALDYDIQREMNRFPQSLLVGSPPGVMGRTLSHTRNIESEFMLSKPVKSAKALNPMRPVASIVSLMKKMVGLKL